MSTVLRDLRFVVLADGLCASSIFSETEKAFWVHGKSKTDAAYSSSSCWEEKPPGQSLLDVFCVSAGHTYMPDKSYMRSATTR